MHQLAGLDRQLANEGGGGRVSLSQTLDQKWSVPIPNHPMPSPGMCLLEDAAIFGRCPLPCLPSTPLSNTLTSRALLPPRRPYLNPSRCPWVSLPPIRVCAGCLLVVVVVFLSSLCYHPCAIVIFLVIAGVFWSLEQNLRQHAEHQIFFNSESLTCPPLGMGRNTNTYVCVSFQFWPNLCAFGFVFYTTPA